MDECLKNQGRPALSDLDLIRRARLEDISAYETLVRRYYEPVYGLVYAMTCGCEEAEAVAQAVFVKAWKAIGHFREQASFRTWVYRIALNQVGSVRKKRGRRKIGRFEEFDPEVKQSEIYRKLSAKGSVLRKMSLGEFQKKMNDAMRSLPEKSRAMVVMFDLQGLTTSAISGVTGGSEEAVGAQLSAAHQRLMEELVGLSSATQESGAPFNIASLFALKAFERPDAKRVEACVQSTLRAVRAAHKRPSLLLFPDKSLGWMFAQPRYGIAALFLLFFVLHVLKGPVAKMPDGVAVLSEPNPGLEMVEALKTNEISTLEIPALHPDYSLVSPLPSEPARRQPGAVK